MESGSERIQINKNKARKSIIDLSEESEKEESEDFDAKDKDANVEAITLRRVSRAERNE